MLWRSGVVTDLGTVGSFSSAYAINDAGQVAGMSNLADGRMHAAYWSGGRKTDLGTLGGSASNAQGINRQGGL